MPQNIIQFQVIQNDTGGGQTVYVLTKEGSIYFKISTLTEGSWQLMT